MNILFVHQNFLGQFKHLAPALADAVYELVADPGEREWPGARARAFAQEHCDLPAACLPRQMQWMQALEA